MNKFRIVFILICLLFASPVWASGTCGDAHCTGSTPWTADSASRADVDYCVNTCASQGETINIPAGDETWGSDIIITQGIIITGAGSGGSGTNITAGNGGFNINLGTDSRVEISNMSFLGTQTENKGAIRGTTDGSVHEEEIDIHDVIFDNYWGATQWSRQHGVIYDCTFQNNEHDAYFWGDYSGAGLGGHPEPPFAYGSDHWMVYEDCIFLNGDGSQIHFVSEHPAPYMIRYSTFTVSTEGQVLDMHGGGIDNGDEVGVWLNNNTVNMSGSAYEWVSLRGGVNIVYDNDASGSSGTPNLVLDSECGSDCDIVHDTYVWENTDFSFNDTGNTVNVDYWLSEPSGFEELAYPHPLRSTTPSATLTGTLSDNGTEAEIKAGGETMIITMSNDTWVATVGDDNAITTALIVGIDSNLSESTGWDAVVRVDGETGLTYTNVVRDPDDVTVTVTMPAFAAYNITANETITITVPATALVASQSVVVNPSFSIAAEGAGPSTIYWVDTDALPATTWASCNGDTDPLVYCHMDTANTNAVAGDTINVLAGTYNGDGPDENIDPANSGSNGSPITYQALGGTVTITGAACNGTAEPAIDIDPGIDYIIVDGIDASTCTFHVMINGGDHNEIKNGTFNRNLATQWYHSRIFGGSQYNWIHDNIFSKGGECSGGNDNGTVLEIGTELSSTDNTDYNLFEDNIFLHGGHHVVGLYGKYNTFRNNYLHNEEWTNSKGNRTLYMMGSGSNGVRNLIESNRFGYTAAPCDATSTGGVLVASSDNIFRCNSFYHNIIHGLLLQVYSLQDVNDNKIYNNTLFNNCDSDEEPSICDGGFEDSAVGFNDWVSGKEVVGNVFKNNLYYSHFTPYTDTDQANIGDQIFVNEYNGNVSGNPLFVNASTTPPSDKTDSSLPDLNLQLGSPAINEGGSLTIVADADTGSGTSLIVDDAKYFQDGTWGPSYADIDADWIAVGTVGNIVQISSISGNIITLASSITRSDGNSIWLYKKSDGVQVLYGSAPDAGAYEYESRVSISGTLTGTIQ